MKKRKKQSSLKEKMMAYSFTDQSSPRKHLIIFLNTGHVASCILYYLYFYRIYSMTFKRLSSIGFVRPQRITDMLN